MAALLPRCWVAPGPCLRRQQPSSSRCLLLIGSSGCVSAAAAPPACRRLIWRPHALDEAAEDAEATPQAADHGARRQQRQAARAARRAASRSDSDEDESRAAVGAAAEANEQPSSSQPAATAAPPPRGSRIAARRQKRSRVTRRRVPAAIVPDDEDDEDEAGSEDDDDAFMQHGAGASDADGEDASADDGDSEDWQLYDQEVAEAAGDDAAAASSSTGQQTLSGSVLEAAGASRKADTASRAATATSKQQQQQQQQQRGQRGSARDSAPVLSEAHPMYVPVLTDEDLDADPPGHKSGYIAVIGKPNAGKSTLINAFVGQKLSIVTFKPQTTRHRVVGIASGDDYQAILFDTPGIMSEQRSKLDERMMAAVVSSIKAAEVIVAVVDAADMPQEALAMFQPGADWSGPPMAVLLNKADLLAPEELEELEGWYRDNCRAEQVFTGSALSSDDGGVCAIKDWAISKLPEGPTLYPKSMVSEQPERFFVSEIIREQIFLQYKQEIPYACQVQIEEFTERRGAKDFIRALILCERESQLPILLGRGGGALRKLSGAAVQQIEEFLGRGVYLELTVKVAPAWRQQPDRLKDFGYFDPLLM